MRACVASITCAECNLHYTRDHLPGGSLVARSINGTLSILVVEDDVAVAELIRTLLNDVPGWGATVVHDAAAARQVFHVVRIEALMIDVNLPGVSGVELIRLLRQDAAWNEPPVLLMSAGPNQPQVRDAMRDGLVTDFLPKPFEVDELVAALATATERCVKDETAAVRSQQRYPVEA